MKGSVAMQNQQAELTANLTNAQPKTGSAAAENQLFHICPVILALILPVLIGLTRPLVQLLNPDIIYVFIGSFPAVVIARLVFDWAAKNESFVICFFRFLNPLKYLENLPPEIVFKSDQKKRKFPWVTLMLVVCNIAVYYCVSEEVSRKCVFAPYGNPSLPHIFISAFTCAFIHGSTSHLFGNMLFLSVFGSIVESKIGSVRFLIAFFLCQTASTITDVVMLKFKYPGSGLITILKHFHSLGSSGAISGIMGLFVVRCFFARFMVCSPFFSLPSLSIPIGIQGSFLACLFFATDVFGSLEMFQSICGIDYWGHLGGYLGGFVLSYCLKLHRDASQEALEVKSEIMIWRKTIRKGSRLHEAALKFLLEHYKHDRKRSEFYFGRLVQAMINSNFKKTIEIFSAYYPHYADTLPGHVLLDIGSHFYKTGDLEKAGKCWESASRKTGSWQGKAKLFLAQRLDRI